MELPREPQTATADKSKAQSNWVHIGFFVLAVATALGVVWMLSGPLSVSVPEDKDLTIENVEDLRNYFWSLGMVVAGIVAIWGLAFAAWRTITLDRQARVAVQDSRLNEQKHASEAFATAIEQLGHDNFAVRLGAVYALEALAKSSKDLHGPIFETLCAYIRESAPIPDDIAEQDAALADRIKNRKEDETIRDIIDNHLETVPKPDVVIQAILSVIGRRDPGRDPHNAQSALDFLLDLRETDLRKADMINGHFEHTLLTDARLDGAELSKARLDGAIMNGSRLDSVRLWGAYLNGAIMTEVRLDGADLIGSNLARAILTKAYLNGADLSGAHLNNVDLSEAHLNGSDLIEAHFGYADLRRTCLNGATLVGARLYGAYLREAFFDGETNVSKATFTGAIGIPAKPDCDFRATVKGADTAKWPDDNDSKAWDRGEDYDDDELLEDLDEDDDGEEE